MITKAHNSTSHAEKDLCIGGLTLSVAQLQQLSSLVDYTHPSRNTFPVCAPPATTFWKQDEKEKEMLLNRGRPAILTIVGLYRKGNSTWYNGNGIARTTRMSIYAIRQKDADAFRSLNESNDPVEQEVSANIDGKTFAVVYHHN